MEIRKSFAIAMFVTSCANTAMAADWSGSFVGISGGYGGGTQTQNGGLLMLPSVGGMQPPSMSSSSTMSSSMASSSMMSTSIISSSMMSTSTISSSMSTSIIDSDGKYKLHGGLVGGAVGYNWQSGRIIYGVAGDGSWADLSGSGTCGIGSASPHACGGGIYALGTIRGRIGYDIQPALAPFDGLMIYGTGGFAVADVHAWDSFRNTSGSRALPGWTAGGGFEARFGEHWSVNVEYLHIDLGTHGLFTAISPNVERVRTTADVGRVGLSYHFNVLGPPPLVARY